MIIFVSFLLYTIQLVLQHCDCLNLIDLQQGRAAHSSKWKLESRRTPAMYGRVMAHTFPRKREIKSNFRGWMHSKKKSHSKIFFKASRRIYEDERDANLKNKLASLVQQTMHGVEESMKEIEPIKQEYREQQPYKAGFVLSMLKKSRDVVNELFNVAIRHRDEWQALEQLKIFEIIVHTNVDTNHLLRQLIDIQNGRDVVLEPNLGPPTGATNDSNIPDNSNILTTDNTNILTTDDTNILTTDNTNILTTDDTNINTAPDKPDEGGGGGTN